MYVPSSFRCTDTQTAFALIEEIRLGTLISAGEVLEASHLPFTVDQHASEIGRLVGHCARANPQWKALDGASEVLVTFLSAHTHVSPSWYSTQPRAPTWLYASVHIRGMPRLITEPAAIRNIVVELSSLMEPPESPWTPGSVDSYIDKILPGIVGFHIDIMSIETQLRLAQQNGPDDRRRVYRALQNGSLSQRLVSQLMERFSFQDLRAEDAEFNLTVANVIKNEE